MNFDSDRQFDPNGSEPRFTVAELFPLIYQLLREIAAEKLRAENAPVSLAPTDLVHEVYVRLAQTYPDCRWKDRQEVLVVCAEVMRRILIDRARKKQSEKHGGAFTRIEMPVNIPAFTHHPVDVLQMNDVLEKLDRHKPQCALYVKLRYFVGFGHQEAADALKITRREADGLNRLARGWMTLQVEREKRKNGDDASPS